VIENPSDLENYVIADTHRLTSRTPFSASLVPGPRQLQNLCGNGVLHISGARNHPRMRQGSQEVAGSPSAGRPATSPHHQPKRPSGMG